MIGPSGKVTIRMQATYGDLATATEVFKKALEGARTLNNFFQMPDTIAITGGTKSESVPEAYRNKGISPIDACAIDGKCNIYGHESLPKINIPRFEAIYGGPISDLVDAANNKNVFAGGATIANPFARLALTDIEPKKIYSISVRDMIENRKYPFTFGLEPLNDRQLLGMSPEDGVNFLNAQKKLYSTPAEEYRMKPARPRWVAELDNNKKKVPHPFEKILIPSRTDSRGYEELKPDKSTDLNRTYAPVGNEGDWIVDYGLVSRHHHPLKDNLDVLGFYGAHRLSTFGGETLPRLTEQIPPDNAHILNNAETLATLHDMIKGEGIKYYQALICTTKTPVGGTSIPPTFLLEPTGKEVDLARGMNYGYTIYTNNMIMLGIIE